MKSALLAILLANVPPGQTYYSVEPSSCGEECGATWSSHYESWVVQESAETGAARYEMIVDALVDEARTLLCTDEAPECVAYRGEASWKYPQPWELDELVALAATTAIYESGFREDVQVGRGRSGEPSDDRGEGRGPSNEACFMQVHPVIAWRFSDDAFELRGAAEQGDREARELIASGLLGTGADAVSSCFRTGLRMLIHARAHCAWAAPQTPWAYATLSLYGTGTTCQGAKSTAKRVATYYRLLRKLRALQEVQGA